MIKEGNLSFTDADDKSIEVKIKDFKIADNEWWSFLVEENVNRNMEVADGPKK
jgi:hypothetical protein